MDLADLKFVYVFFCLVSGLIVLSPTLALVVQFPEGEMFSEFWILGSEHMLSDYPFNVSAGENFTVYLGVGSHMGGVERYRIYVKLGNQTDVLPNMTLGAPSPVNPLFEFQLFVEDDEVWETPFTFSFSDVVFYENRSSIETVIFNNHVIQVDKGSSWDEEEKGYYYQLFFELWLYDLDSEDFVFHNRFVSLQLNMTGV